MQSRRRFLKGAAISLISLSPLLASCSSGSRSSEAPPPVTPPTNGTPPVDTNGLLAADLNGVKLPPNFSSRIVARSGFNPISSSPYVWHGAPDGGAVFETDSGGWVYVSNSELNANQGGVGALVFDANANIVDAYSILDGTTRNCAGGTTPWNTWLSCEETSRGMVWECDPFGVRVASVKPMLGVFAHEAVAFDSINNHFYLTEDRSESVFYRFIPNGLDAGILQVAILNENDSTLSWVDLPDPLASSTSTRFQVPEATIFSGGEGIVFNNGVVTFATKNDNRIWAYDVRTNKIEVIYDISTNSTPLLEGVDNIAVSPDGNVVVAEDGGDLQIVKINSDLSLTVLLQLEGHNNSEVTGPAFSPDGTRLYFSSQRGTSGSSNDGVTFEITGPFV